MTTVGMAVSGLRRRLFRTTLTVLSVAVATGIFVVTMSAMLRFRHLRQSDATLPRILVATQNADDNLPLSYAERLKHVSGVKWVWWLDGARGSAGEDRFFSVWAVSPDFFELQSPALLGTTAEAKAAFKADRQGLLVSRGLLEMLGKSIGDAVQYKVRGTDVTGKILGVIEGDYASGVKLMAMHYETLDEVNPPAYKHTVGNYVAGGDSIDGLPDLAKRIDTEFATAGVPTLSLPSWQAMDSGTYRPMMVIPVMLQKITALLLAVTVLVTGSTLAMSLRERRADFGVLRALGFSQSRVFRLVLTETIALSLIAAALGAGVPFALFHHQGLNLGSFIMSNVPVGPIAAGAGVAMAVIVAVVAVLWPAVETARLNVVETLGKA